MRAFAASLAAGTGRSTAVTWESLAALGGADEQANYVACMRADSIVKVMTRESLMQMHRVLLYQSARCISSLPVSTCTMLHLVHSRRIVSSSGSDSWGMTPNGRYLASRSAVFLLDCHPSPDVKFSSFRSPRRLEYTAKETIQP